MDSRRDFTPKKAFPGYFSELSEKANPPQTEHSGGPLGDPSARVFEVFLTVSQSVVETSPRPVFFIFPEKNLVSSPQIVVVLGPISTWV